MLSDAKDEMKLKMKDERGRKGGGRKRKQNRTGTREDEGTGPSNRPTRSLNYTEPGNYNTVEATHRGIIGEGELRRGTKQAV